MKTVSYIMQIFWWLMKVKFRIVTPCRRYNIPDILFRNLSPWVYQGYDIEWYIIYDTYGKIYNDAFKNIPWIHEYSYRNPKSQGGHDQLNFSFSLFDDGIFFALDDDTVIHPRFFPVMAEEVPKSGKPGFLFHDQLKEDQIYPAYPHNIRACVVGQQNFALDRKLVGDRKYGIPYCEDGVFIERLYKDKPKDFHFIDEVLAYHNRLRKNNWRDYI